MKKNTEKAVKQIPGEIRKLTRVVATIGETLIDARIGQIKRGKQAAKSVVPNQKTPKADKK